MCMHAIMEVSQWAQHVDPHIRPPWGVQHLAKGVKEPYMLLCYDCITMYALFLE